jgi:hypothetical protein
MEAVYFDKRFNAESHSRSGSHCKQGADWGRSRYALRCGRRRTSVVNPNRAAAATGPRPAWSGTLRPGADRVSAPTRHRASDGPGLVTTRSAGTS